MGGKFPTLEQPQFSELEVPSTLVLALPPIAAGVFGALTLSGVAGYASGVTAGWLLLGHCLKVWQAHHKDEKARKLRGPARLAGCLHVMHAAVLGSRGYSPKSEDDRKKLRVTIHRVEAEEAVQILEYVGGEPLAQGETRVGRRRSVRSGVVGRAFTSADPARFRRGDDDFRAYKREMREKWAMSAEEAEELDAERFSHLAIPIGSANSATIAAVVFLDSSERDFFTADVESLVTVQCIGMADYVEMGYE